MNCNISKRKSNGKKDMQRRKHYRDHRGHVYNSTLIAEKALGKELPPNAVVHHADRDKSNDKSNNLVICENQAYHLFLHQRKRAYNACGNKNWRKCWICKKYDDPGNLYVMQPKAYHRECHNIYQRKLRANKGA